MISRRINWVSSVHPESYESIEKLELALKQYYSTSKEYYEVVDFTAINWIDRNEEGYSAISSVANASARICEIGCGQANILLHHPHLALRYTGCDFSDNLMHRNQMKYPDASFVSITKANELPFPDASFDFVFSVFVIEHSTRPSQLLKECHRILVPGGKLMILCPDFLGRNRMTSQRAGWSAGTANQKLRKGKLIDALITLYDNRIRIPLVCKRLKSKLKNEFGFYINLSPVVFQDPFTPDVDAVYITYKHEIVSFLSDTFGIQQNSEQMLGYEESRGLIFVEAIKSK